MTHAHSRCRPKVHPALPIRPNRLHQLPLPAKHLHVTPPIVCHKDLPSGPNSNRIRNSKLPSSIALGPKRPHKAPPTVKHLHTA
eukprot:CAMPEP_0173386112 /NCGR_PEP_ID=MMETSP1356-20130122/8704_1 /TAXON_ID=77927 ORGANISM="Hemiselmis virescens, Strain PCC157" /NCGR_SAMPLE_ID=MMETSP1356 /ASSEMBLY_ACC=CAM_ASM_000847 /LENGTH=83 /DNA_ID=CAMNT_0014342207 /DNA_START=60 /DNA_END=311 /DNA_ORIENTATION=+